jgi:hypothetical protein
MCAAYLFLHDMQPTHEGGLLSYIYVSMAAKRGGLLHTVIREQYYIWRYWYQLVSKSLLTMIAIKITTKFNTNNRNGDYLKVGWCVEYSVYAAEVIWFLMCRSIWVRRVWKYVNVIGLFRGVILVLSWNYWCEQWKICKDSRFSGTNSKRLSAKHRRRITIFDGCMVYEDDHSAYMA